LNPRTRPIRACLPLYTCFCFAMNPPILACLTLLREAAPLRDSPSMASVNLAASRTPPRKISIRRYLNGPDSFPPTRWVVMGARHCITLQCSSTAFPAAPRHPTFFRCPAGSRIQSASMDHCLSYIPKYLCRDTPLPHESLWFSAIILWRIILMDYSLPDLTPRHQTSTTSLRCL